MSRSLLLLALLCACEREKRRFSDPAPLSSPAMATPLGELRAGATIALTADPPKALPHELYQENAWAVSEGKRLFTWFNCVGCHGRGGGGSGPALMDDDWRYGSRPADVYESIVRGRPNGMPAFAGKITEQQAWQLAAYVRSLSGLTRLDVAPGRADKLRARPPETMLDHQERGR